MKKVFLIKLVVITKVKDTITIVITTSINVKPFFMYYHLLL